jgi:hypothetical protein
LYIIFAFVCLVYFLNTVSFSYIHFAAMAGFHTSLLMNNIVCEYVYISFIRSPIGGYSDRFHSLAVVNKAAV